MLEKPIISVIMGVYYHRDNNILLRRSIESIIGQTFYNYEFLICDDGSNDDAIKLVEEYAKKDARIRIIKREEKFDLASKLNACLAEAKGKYIARMDDDDLSLPLRLEKQIEVLENRPEVAFVGCNVSLVGDGISAAKMILPESPKVQDFYVTQPFIHPTLMFRRTVLDSVGGYNEEKWCNLCEDYDLLLRIYAKGYKGVNLQDVLFDYTVSNSAKSNRTMRHRLNETVTRFRRFCELGVMPKAFPYVIKPLVVGVLPEATVKVLKSKNRRIQR